MKKILSTAIAMALPLMPKVAAACPACFSASDKRTLAAYYASTMLLSLMPFAAIGVVVLGAYAMRNRAAEAEDRES